MSASEKLERLLQGRAGFPADQRHVGDAVVIAALPEIIAVVEALESTVPKDANVRHPRRSALTALDEKLGA